MASKAKRAYASSTLKQPNEQPPKVMKTDVIEADDFDVESENPFSAPSCGSDVALVVEDKKLHVHKSVLSLHSPVFRAMFTSNFSEKDASEVPLPTKKYDAVLNFLLHLYPVYSLKNIAGDIALASVLPLAHEYQAKHVLLKCNAYIQAALYKLGNDTRSLIFLYLCEKYNVFEQFDAVLRKAALCQINVIEENRFYKMLLLRTQMQLLRQKCRNAEGVTSDSDEEGFVSKIDSPYVALEAKVWDALNL